MTSRMECDQAEEAYGNLQKGMRLADLSSTARVTPWFNVITATPVFDRANSPSPL